MLSVGGLFSGIGGIELGLQNAGMRVLWHAERDEFCRRVLERRWPGVPCYGDVREVTGEVAEAPDLLCGGFPCQDFSVLGRRSGLDGEKSGLWSEFHRAIRELRPRYVLVENVPDVLVLGAGRILGDLAGCGYDAEWDCLPAAAFGALHLRARFWLLAYPTGGRHGAPQEAVFAGRGLPELRGRWAHEPDVGRVATGVPDGVDRRRVLGNAVVPLIAQWIGERVIAYETAAPESCSATTRVYAEVVRCCRAIDHAGWHRGSSRGIEATWTSAAAFDDAGHPDAAAMSKTRPDTTVPDGAQSAAPPSRKEQSWE